MKKIRLKLQLLFFAIFNHDIVNFFRTIYEKKARVSQSHLKNICIPGLHCYSCPSAVTSCPIGALQFWLNDVAMKFQLKEKINLAGFYIIGFLSLSGIIGGRFFCGWVCPFGLTQELINKITRKNIAFHKLFLYLKYIIFSLFVIILPLLIYDIALLSPWFCKYICPAGTLYAGIPLIAVDEGLRQSLSYLTLLKTTILISFIILILFSNRAFCKIGCPLGAFWGLFNKISLFKLHINHTKCTSCNLCGKKCMMNITVFQNPNSNECIRCLECVNVCPTNAISFKIDDNLSFNKTKLINKEDKI